MVSSHSERGSGKKNSVGFVLVASAFMLLLAFAPSIQNSPVNNTVTTHIQSYTPSNNSSIAPLIPPLSIDSAPTTDSKPFISMENPTDIIESLGNTSYANSSDTIAPVNDASSAFDASPVNELPMNVSQVETITTTKMWTLIFYMGGIGAQDMDGGLDHDIGDLKYVKSDANIDMLVLIDYTEIGNARAFSVTSSGGELSIPLTSIDPTWINNEVNIGNPATLATWGVYCIQHYPASNYAVIIDDHGAGIEGSSQDEQTGDVISPFELGTAMSQMKTANGGYKVDLLALDLCRAGLLEEADECRNYVDCLVSSEMDSWWYPGEPGTFDFATTIGVLKQAPGINCYDLGKEIVKNDIAAWTAKSYSCTLSCIDLGLMPTFNQKLNTLAQRIFDKWSLTLKGQITTAMQNTQAFAGSANLDIRDFASKIYQYVTDSQIRTDANDLYNYLAENPSTGFIRKNGHFTGTSNDFPGESNRATDRASGLATFMYSTLDPAQYWYDMQWLVRNIQNDTAWDKMLRAYYGMPTYPLVDDFTYYINTWQTTYPGGNVIWDDTTYNVQSRSMLLQKLAQTGIVAAQHYFNQQGKIVVQASLKVTSTSGPYEYFIVRDSVGNYCVHTAIVDGYFKYYTGSTWVNVKSVTSAKWIHVLLAIDPSASTFDIYIDGKLEKTGAPFRVAATGGYLCGVYFQAGWADTATSNLWVDDICVNGGSLKFTDCFQTAPGSNSWTLLQPGGTVTKDTTKGYYRYDASTVTPSAKLDKTVTTPSYVAMYHTFPSQSTHIIAEAAMMVSSASTQRFAIFDVRSGLSVGVRLVMSEGTFRIQDGSPWPWLSIGVTYSANVWYRITLDIDIQLHTVDIYIDGTLRYSNAGWLGASLTSLDNIYFQSQSSDQAPILTTWVDNVLVTT